MKKKHKYSNSELTWTVCQHILGEVIPSLRAIACEWKAECIVLFFYHDGAINNEIEDHYLCIGTEVIADYPNASISEKIISSPYPQSLPNHDYWAYRRKEPFVDPIV